MIYSNNAAQPGELERVKHFVKTLDFNQVTGPMDRNQMREQLNVENPLVIDLVNHWIEVRCRRLQFERIARRQVQMLKHEFESFQQDVMRVMAEKQEAEWEDCDSEASDEEEKCYVLEGKRVSKADVANML